MRKSAVAPERSEELVCSPAGLHLGLPELLVDYGAWVDDTKFRELYLRPFDACWGKKAFSFEEYLDWQLQSYGGIQH